ncbi:hypothetical protein [Actinacidiphila acidipaludis]|uniref:DUF1877 family protein n=1 Tax=Actinacidiphila acidipaludis TaxID=2873382 RepID=A0ABS7QFT1_9ACTN|nr:hypothetical protein [Streptomyces acidipaludis]MBY8881295.1 hypothetical protein [Streptomyces acidipaludis]
MTLCDYFSAPDDAAAVAVIGTPGGPIPAGFDAISLKDIDPVVVLGRLEALIAERGHAAAGTAESAAGAAQLVSSPDSEGPFVFRVPDTLTAALAAAGPAELVRAAEPWSRTDELRQFGIDAPTAAGMLEVLAALARRAREGKARVYCWWAL